MQEKNKTPFSKERAEENLGFLLWQASIIWQRKIRQKLDSYDLSHSQFVIMATLMWFNLNDIETTQVAIINWTKLDKMTVSKSLKKLGQLELISRVEHKIDTRAKSVSLTDKGKDLITQLIPIVENIDDKFFIKLDNEEQKVLINIFTKLIKE